MRRSLIPLAFAIGSATVASAQLPDVAIVAASGTSLTSCEYTDVQSKLLATGRFNSVDLIDCMSQTPTLQDLSPYDGVITWSNFSYQNATLLGDVLADYVDGGGGVVVAIFATSTTTANRSLLGRWSTGGYEVIMPRSGNFLGAASLGNVLVPGHPLMAGVNTLSAGNAFRATTTTILQGQIVAEWNDGKILVAEGANPNRVDLGLFPPSSACAATWWLDSTDGAVLLANSLVHVSSGGVSSIGTNYCTAVANSTGVPGSISATGSTAVASNDVTLLASSLPMNAFGYYLTSQTQGFVVNPGGSQGNLCLGGGIGRFVGPGQVQNSGAAGEISLALDLGMHPTPGGLVPVMAGETWNFTLWYRDQNPGVTSNFTDGLEVTFV